MKFFIVAADSRTTSIQADAVTGFLKDKGVEMFGFWHWIPNFWIVHSMTDRVTSAWLRDELGKVSQGMAFAVFGVDPRTDDWAMHANPQWGPWVERNWK